MGMSADGEEAILKVLIVDDQPFQRRLIAETVRVLGRVRIEQADSAGQCFETLGCFLPDLIITDWDMEGGDGLSLAKRLRAGEAGAHLKAIPIVMVAERNMAGEVEAARNCGVDEFVLKPFNTKTLLARVKAVRKRRREFIESASYNGPCRRRRAPADGAAYDGPRRRLFDADDEHADTPDVQIKKGLARMYAEHIQTLALQAAPGAPKSMRDVLLSCAQLNQLAGDMGEKILMSACESLLAYVKGVGANGVLNQEVVKAQLAAIVQLAELPNSQYDIRATVARELGVMVAKKLRAASAA